ncbi:hypothetical protein G9A89_003751 [Geosiphon pyriformis]|nr:hypothetical protein G9A89_003751 [Geosiphon pyriformis]
MCVINYHLVTYAKARCAIVCFDSAESLDAIMRTTPILRGAHLCWSYLGFATCAKCERLDHTSLNCGSNEKLPSAPVTRPVAFGSASWASVVSRSFFPPFSGQNVFSKNDSSLEIRLTPLVSLKMNDRFTTLKCSLTSLTECVNKLAKRLDTFGPTVFQLRADIVISEDLGVATSGEAVVRAVVFDLLVVLKMEKTLKNLSVMVMSLSAKMNNAGLVPVICSS